MQKSKHHVVVDEFSFDSDALVSLYEKMAHCSLPWNEYKTAIKNRNNLEHTHQGRGDGGLGGVYSPMYEGKHMHEYKEIQDVVNKFNFLEPLGPDDVTFMTYQPGFTFKKHTDRQMHYNIMMPIIYGNEPECITFWKGEDHERDTTTEQEYTYNYNTQHPTIFNGKTIHSVDTIKEFRVVFRIKITHETYEDMIARYEAGEFLNV